MYINKDCPTYAEYSKLFWPTSALFMAKLLGDASNLKFFVDDSNL